MNVKQHCSKKWSQHKEKVFAMIGGQCGLSANNKSESNKDHKDWNQKDGVKTPLENVKVVLHSTTEVRCKCQSLTMNSCDH